MMFFSSLKGINRLISKGMSNICLKVTVEKSWRSQNFNFLSLKILSPEQFLESFNSCRYYWIFKTFCCNLKIRGLEAIILILKGIMTF